MPKNICETLAWLPSPPDDFNDQVAGLSESSSQFADKIRQLASYALTESQMRRLAKRFDAARSAGAELGELVPLRLAVISNATTDYFPPVLVASALRHGLSLEVYLAPYAQTMQEVLNVSSQLYEFQPDVVLCALDYRGLPLNICAGDKEFADEQIDNAIAQVETIIAAVEKHSRAICVCQTLARPPETLFGSLDACLPGTWRDLTTKFNQRLAEKIASSTHLLLDVGGIAETVGLENWHDLRLWNIGKIPFSSDFLPVFGDHLGRLLGAWKGKSRRSLILDLDNTCWGGVIGDDGIGGIKIAEGDAVGESFRDVQRAAVSFRERGIVLTVCSKNDDQVAREPFRTSDEMILKEDQIAVFQANWRDKATNIEAISEELSLGLDAFVFLDDNPMERDIVRTMLGNVAVPELSVDPTYYARTLFFAGYFEATAFSEEDKQRADDYQSNAKRLALQSSAGDLDGYLRSLEMEIVFRPFDQAGTARITQLINKSNQFNLTTRRYSEDEVISMTTDPGVVTYQVRLRDKFGDNGMISVIILRVNKDEWEIDTWLMSCRVLGRKVEEAVMANLLVHAQAGGIKRIVGVYRPTKRNAMVAEHYEKLGFEKSGSSSDGSTTWQYEVGTQPEFHDCPMTIVDHRE